MASFGKALLVPSTSPTTDRPKPSKTPSSPLSGSQQREIIEKYVAFRQPISKRPPDGLNLVRLTWLICKKWNDEFLEREGCEQFVCLFVYRAAGMPLNSKLCYLPNRLSLSENSFIILSSSLVVKSGHKVSVKNSSAYSIW